MYDGERHPRRRVGWAGALEAPSRGCSEMGSCACVHIDSIVVATLVCTLTLIIMATLVCTNSVRGRDAPERLLCFPEILP